MPDIPTSSPAAGHLLIRTTCSLLSAGTERMLVEFGQSNLIDKARQQPDKLQQVFQKSRTDGLFSTLDSVRDRLNFPLPLGYCNVGVVVAVGSGVTGFNFGDRVASNGNHAEFVCVPQNLCAVIPDSVSDESASFTVPASIGLQGIRLANPTIGETFVVSGLGLIGLLTAQLLVSHGCRVLGLDPDSSKCDFAETLGISALNLSTPIDPLTWLMDRTDSMGVDGVLITAATSSSEPVHLAAQACRQRGRIVLIGVTGLELRRELFYKKELTFQVSCSYGPGRYDPTYEQQGHDYPIGFVRWTEQRNFQAVLHALSTGSLRTESLISHRFSIDQASTAYKLLCSPDPSLAILFKYSGTADSSERTVELQTSNADSRSNVSSSVLPRLGFIGAGNYASRF